MIDYFFRFADESDAIAKASAANLFGRYVPAFDFAGVDSPADSPPAQLPDVWVWDTSYVLPNLKAWRISQDSPPGQHVYLTGWFAIVSVPEPMAKLNNLAELQFALFRDGPPYVYKNNIGAVIRDVNCSPMFAGHHYPIGGLGSADDGLIMAGRGQMSANTIQKGQTGATIPATGGMSAQATTNAPRAELKGSGGLSVSVDKI